MLEVSRYPTCCPWRQAPNGELLMKEWWNEHQFATFDYRCRQCAREWHADYELRLTGIFRDFDPWQEEDDK
jgi:hypothetical protein